MTAQKLCTWLASGPVALSLVRAFTLYSASYVDSRPKKQAVFALSGYSMVRGITALLPCRSRQPRSRGVQYRPPAAAHLHITVLGDVERGVGNPEYATLLRLAQALDVAPGALVTRADELRMRQDEQ